MKYQSFLCLGLIILCLSSCTKDVDDYIEQLENKNYQQREAAVKALIELKDQKSVWPLINMLKNRPSKEGYVRTGWMYSIGNNVQTALVNIGEPAVDSLITALVDKNYSNARYILIPVLAEINDERAVPPLIELLNDKNQEIRELAIEALGNFGDERAIKPLLAELNESELNSKIIRALVNLDASELVVELIVNVKPSYITKDIKVSLVEIGEPAVKGLISSVQNNRNLESRLLHLEILGSIKSPTTVEPLITVLKDQNNQIRKSATKILGVLGDHRAVQPLVELLDDKDFKIRMEVVYALSKLAHKNAIGPLRKVLLTDKQKSVRKAAIAVLVKLDKNHIVDFLSVLITDIQQERSIRLDAIDTIAKLNSSKVVEPLITLLNEKNDPYFQIKAARILAELGAEKAVQPLRETLLKEKSQYTQSGMAKALYKLEGNKVLDYLSILLKDKDYRIRENSVNILGELKIQESVGLLITALKDNKNEVRREAAEVLGGLGNVKAAESLRTALFNDKEEVVRLCALESLIKLKYNLTDTLIIYLTDINDDSERLIVKAAEALGNSKDDRVVQVLVASYKKVRSWDSKTNIAFALSNFPDKQLIPIFLPHIKDFDAKEWVVKTLDILDWQPSNIDDSVHYNVAKKYGDKLRGSWEEAQRILLKDIMDKRRGIIKNAVFAFIGIGKGEVIPILTTILNRSGTVTMAEVYLNCGHKELEQAAREWAKRNGYIIRKTTFGSVGPGWKSW